MLVILFDSNLQSNVEFLQRTSTINCFRWNIHHPQVKKRLTRSSVFQAIRELPVVFQVDNTGQVQLYSGNNAFSFVSSLLAPRPELMQQQQSTPVAAFDTIIPQLPATRHAPATVRAVVEDEVEHEVDPDIPPAAPRGASWGEFESDDIDITPESASAPAVPLIIKKPSMITSNADMTAAKKSKPGKLTAVEMAKQMALERGDPDPTDSKPRMPGARPEVITHTGSLHPDPPGLEPSD